MNIWRHGGVVWPTTFDNGRVTTEDVVNSWRRKDDNEILWDFGAGREESNAGHVSVGVKESFITWLLDNPYIDSFVCRFIRVLPMEILYTLHGLFEVFNVFPSVVVMSVAFPVDKIFDSASVAFRVQYFGYFPLLFAIL